MKFKSEVLTQASGSIGGTTYAHNRGGLYRRARSIPTNPNSAAQQTVRTNFGQLATRWNDTLTTAQRSAWENYAANSPTTDALGDSLVLTGQQMYIRCNSVRLRGSLTAVDDGPTTFGLADLSTVTIPVDPTSNDINVAFNNSDPWAGEVGGALIVQTSRFYDGSKNYLKGPFRYLGLVTGAASPPTSPNLMASANAFGQAPTSFTAGQVMFWRACAVRADGRLSAVQSYRTILDTP